MPNDSAKPAERRRKRILPSEVAVGQVWDTGGGDLADVVEIDTGLGGAAHFVWRDRNYDAWWTKRLIPLGWKVVTEDG